MSKQANSLPNQQRNKNQLQLFLIKKMVEHHLDYIMIIAHI